MIFAIEAPLDVDTRIDLTRTIEVNPSDALLHDSRLVHVCVAEPGQGHYSCIYCNGEIHLHGRHRITKCYHHDNTERNDCIVSDRYLPGFLNPASVTEVC